MLLIMILYIFFGLNFISKAKQKKFSFDFRSENEQPKNQKKNQKKTKKKNYLKEKQAKRAT